MPRRGVWPHAQFLRCRPSMLAQVRAEPSLLGLCRTQTASMNSMLANKAVCIVFAQGDFLYSIPDAFCCVENMVLAANGQAPS